MSYMKNLYIQLHNTKPTTCSKCGKESLHELEAENIYYCSECGHNNFMGGNE